MLLLVGVQLLFDCPENRMEIWLTFLFLSREKCHAKQIFVLSSAMKLAPGVRLDLWTSRLVHESVRLDSLTSR